MSRRLAVVGTLGLVAMLAGGYLWWGLSGRYDRALAKSCAGMLPARESEPFADGDLKNLHSSAAEAGYFCRIGNELVQIARVSDKLDHHADVLYSGVSGSEVTVPLGGGWHGFTDMSETGVTLSCTNRPESVLVLATGLGDELTPATAHPVAELVTAVAARAAAHYHCLANLGGKIPAIATPPTGMSSATPSGTCRGLPLRGTDGTINWQRASPESGSSPLEKCVLGWEIPPQAGDEQPSAPQASFHFVAAFGPYATRNRYPRSSPDNDWVRDSGVVADSGEVWGSARCPDTEVRALFFAWSDYASDLEGLPKNFLTMSLRAFAERSAQRHGCTDLRLPA